MTVEQRSGQRRGCASQVDALALAELAVDHDARDTLQCFGQILVRKLADVLRCQVVLNAGGLPLALERLAQTRADAVDDDFLQITRLGRRGTGALLRLNRTIASEQRHRDCRSDQRRPCDSHDLPTPDVVVSRCPFSPWPNSRKTLGIARLRVSARVSLLRPLTCQYNTTTGRILYPSIPVASLGTLSKFFQSLII